MSALATPTPMIEPIRVWEEEAGSPSHQVPRFQMMAAIKSANTMAKPAPEPTCRISSTGSSVMMPKATAPLENSTPEEVQRARIHHREMRLQRVRVDDGRDRVGGVVEAVDELEAERDEQRDAEQEEGQQRQSSAVVAPLMSLTRL